MILLRREIMYLFVMAGAQHRPLVVYVVPMTEKPLRLYLCQDTNPVYHPSVNELTGLGPTDCAFFVSSISWNITHPVLGFRVNMTDVGCTWKI
jgi:hypothetical protein